jgi:hypothetical protein
MTPTDWDMMTPNEQNCWIATYIFGLIVETGLWLTFETVDSDFKPLKPYISDLSAAMEAEEKIMQMGTKYQFMYFKKLHDIIASRGTKNVYWPLQLIHASAADRSKAIFLTINAINGKEEGK